MGVFTLTLQKYPQTNILDGYPASLGFPIMPRVHAIIQGFMQDENVARRDPGKVLFEYLVGCFGTSQLERATRFPDVPTRARNSFLSVQYYYLGKLTVQLILNIPLLLAMYSQTQKYLLDI